MILDLVWTETAAGHCLLQVRSRLTSGTLTVTKTGVYRMLRRYLGRLGWLGVIAALLVAVGIVLTATKSFLGGGAVIVAALVLTQLGPQIIAWVKIQREQDRAEAGLLHIRCPIGEVDPFEEGFVFSSKLAERGHEGHEPPYIPREGVDTTLREALKTKQFVLVVGQSSAGKSRTAFEAARNMETEPILLVPSSPEELPELLRLGLPVDRSRPSVLWLDNLDNYLMKAGMSRARFHDLGERGNCVVVLATMTLTAQKKLQGGEGEIGRSPREILHLFEPEITVSSENSDTEREKAEALYPGQRFVAGIGEHFAAARELVKEFKTGREDHHHGFAVVVAALDWRRAGLTRPITEAELRELYALCLERFSPLSEANDDDYQVGLAWACKPLPLVSSAALLTRAKNGRLKTFEIFDYIRDWSDSAGGDVDQSLRAVPQSTWHFVISRVAPEEALAVGLAAYNRDNPNAAEGAWMKVANSDDSEWAPMAAFNLGLLLAEQGEPGRAEEFYQRAIDSGHSEVAPRAALSLGWLLAKQGEPGRAKEFYQRAIDLGHSEGAPRAAIGLGFLLAKQGEPERAEKFYQRAIDSGHSEWAPSATFGLGGLLAKQGEPERAEKFYQRAIDSGHSEWAPRAAQALQQLRASSPEDG